MCLHGLLFVFRNDTSVLMLTAGNSSSEYTVEDSHHENVNVRSPIVRTSSNTCNFSPISIRHLFGVRELPQLQQDIMGGRFSVLKREYVKSNRGKHVRNVFTSHRFPLVNNMFHSFLLELKDQNSSSNLTGTLLKEEFHHEM